MNASGSRLDRDGRATLLILAACTLAFAILPFGRLIGAALAPSGVLDPGPAIAELTGRAAVRAAWNTIESAGLSALVATILGGGAAALCALTDVRGSRPFAFLFVLSMLMAPQVVALGFLMLAGPSSPLLVSIGLAPEAGSINPLLGRPGVITVLAAHHAPLVFVTLTAGLRAVPRDVIEAATLCGASGWTLARRIVLPVVRGHLVAGGFLAFVAAVGNFGIPALLGMPVNYLTLPTLIYRRLSSFGPSIIGDAAALSVLVAVIAGLGVALSAIVLRGAPRPLAASEAAGIIFRLGRWRPLAEAILALVVFVVLVLPLTSLVVAALVPTYGVPLTFATLTLDNFQEILFRQTVTLRAFRNSFLFAAAAAVLLAILGVLVAYALDRTLPRGRRVVEAVIEIPYALPGIVLAIACILLFLRPLPVVGVSLYATPWIILFAYMARFLPLALKPVLAGMAQLSRDEEEAAAVFGAGFLQRLRYVVLPAIRPSATAGALLVFMTAFNELTVSALLWTAGTETLGVALFNLEEAGLVSQASAVALTATAIIACVMIVLDRLAQALPAGTLPWRP